MLKSSHIHVNNYNKIRKVTQEKDKNTAHFLSWLTEAVQKYTYLDISTPAGLLYLHVQFISQLAPNIRWKLCQLEKGPKSPQWDLLKLAFKFFNNRKEEAKKEKGKKKKRPHMLYSLQLSKGKNQPLWPINLSPPIGNYSPGPCFRCNQTGHWAKSCRNPCCCCCCC